MAAPVQNDRLAQAIPPQSLQMEAGVWSAALRNVLDHGRLRAANARSDASFGLSEHDGPPGSDHKARHIFAYGRYDQEGTWHTEKVVLIAESVEHRTNGRLYRERRVFELSPEGTLVRGDFHRLIEEADGRLASAGHRPMAPPEVEYTLKRMVERFSQFSPQQEQGALETMEPVRTRVAGNVVPTLQPPRGGIGYSRAG